MTREEALRMAVARLASAGCPEPRAEAEVLLAHVLRTDRVRLLLERGAPLEARSLPGFERSVARRLKREPVAYITGEREFWSLAFKVNRAVLIPRPETETLVQQGLELLRKAGFHGTRPASGSAAKARVVDVGTGSGCVAVALAHSHPGVSVVGIDSSARALAVAAKNVARHGLENRVILRRGDLFRERGRRGEKGTRRSAVEAAHLILSNPPYVADSEWNALPPEIRDWESAEALRGGPDGLDVLRRLAREAPGYLVRGGWIAVEVGAGQACAVKELFGSGDAFGEIRIAKDLAGTDRVVSARRRR